MRRSSTSLIAALLAVLALLTHPVAAAAAQAACAMGDQATASAAQVQTDMAAMPGMAKVSGVKAASADPCCDHSDQQQKPMDGKSCALACATTCVVPAVLPAVQANQALTYLRTASPPAHDVWPGDHSPSGLERPPKSIL